MRGELACLSLEKRLVKLQIARLKPLQQGQGLGSHAAKMIGEYCHGLLVLRENHAIDQVVGLRRESQPSSDAWNDDEIISRFNCPIALEEAGVIAISNTRQYALPNLCSA